MKASYFQFCAALAFVRLLDREGLSVRYASYLRARHGVSVINFLYRTEPSDYISGAFNFTKTPEGFDFWFDLSDRWNKFLLKLTF